MDLSARLAPFAPLDAFAVGFILLTWIILGWVIEHPPASRPSVSVLMSEYRRDWMRQFVTRQPRIFDATVIDSLRQGTAFFDRNWRRRGPDRQLGKVGWDCSRPDPSRARLGD
jgi:Protein of unknown function, DUF599